MLRAQNVGTWYSDAVDPPSCAWCGGCDGWHSGNFHRYDPSYPHTTKETKLSSYLLLPPFVGIGFFFVSLPETRIVSTYENVLANAGCSSSIRGHAAGAECRHWYSDAADPPSCGWCGGCDGWHSGNFHRYDPSYPHTAKETKLSSYLLLLPFAGILRTRS